MNRSCLLWITVLVSLACAPWSIAQVEGVLRVDLFTVGDGPYQSIRIPAITALPDGTLLVAAVGRRAVSDWADMDLLLLRSVDGGATWSEPQVLARGGGKACDNANLIVEPGTGRVHFVYQRDYAQLFHAFSDDDGVSFSEPAEITAALDSLRTGGYNWSVVAPGPGSGICTDTGRLIVPVWVADSPEPRRHRPSSTAVIYSDDGGTTWLASDLILRDSTVTPNPSESDIVQLPDGRVMLNTRTESKQHLRAVMVSDNGISDWSESVFDEQLYDPICHASLAIADVPQRPGEHMLLFVNPDSRTQRNDIRPSGLRPRENLSIKVSFDMGKTWPISRVLDPERSGYSDMTVAPDGRIHVVYERGYIPGNDLNTRYLSLLTIDPNALLAGDSFAE